MKKLQLSLMLALLLGFGIEAMTQSLYICPLIESSIAGAQFGGSVGYRGKSGLMAGGFYQAGKVHVEIGPAARNVFCGVEGFVPLVRAKKLSFLAHVRMGMANNLFFVVVPGAETVIRLNNKVSAGTGISWRYGHGAIGARVFVML